MMMLRLFMVMEMPTMKTMILVIGDHNMVPAQYPGFGVTLMMMMMMMVVAMAMVRMMLMTMTKVMMMMMMLITNHLSDTWCLCILAYKHKHPVERNLHRF